MYCVLDFEFNLETLKRIRLGTWLLEQAVPGPTVIVCLERPGRANTSAVAWGIITMISLGDAFEKE